MPSPIDTVRPHETPEGVDLVLRFACYHQAMSTLRESMAEHGFEARASGSGSAASPSGA